MKNLLNIFLIVIISICYFSQFKQQKQITIRPVNNVSFSFVGDLMCHAPQYEYARISADSFDFKPVFNEVKFLLAESDFTIGNLETVVAGKEFKYSSYPMFNTPEDYLRALQETGFDVLITSNNHSLDRGIIGVNRTIDQIKKYRMRNVGTYKTAIERDSIFYVEKNGFRIALLSYTYALNGNELAEGKKFAVNLIDTNLIKKDIWKAHQKKADIVLVYFHFGEEYQRQPNSYQKDIVERTIRFGADAIIASHPHVIQKVELFEPKNKNIEKGFVAYSLGNFLSNQRWRYSDCGVILNFSYQKSDSGKIVLKSISAIPTWVYKGSSTGKREFIIIPSDTSSSIGLLKSLSKIDNEKIHQSFADTENIMGIVIEHSGKISSRKN
jgi:poly-gamma-glutamate capsule biosynthesis protein CapA/YwtB (metallophosphatase superfamily)